VNNETILKLEKTLVKLPEAFNKLIEPQTLAENETKYKKYLCKWFSSLAPDILNTTDYTKLCETPEYKQYKKKATDYFVSKEIETYKSNSNDQDIKNQQKELTTLNSQIKTELQELFVLDTQLKEIEQKQSQYQSKIEHIENDILNVKDNNKLNDELEANKLKRTKYETRITKNEEVIDSLRKTQKLINTYENLEKDVKFIEIEIKQKEELLIKFEKYKDQIENNNSIQKEIDLVKAELDEFEEVLEEVEKQYTIENTNITKYTALLEQIKKDLAEYKAIEKNLKLYEVYKKSMKQLPYILLNKIQPLLEKKVNDLLTIITDFTIKFDISDNKIDIYLDRPIYNMNNSNSNTNTSLNYLNNKNSSKANRYILINNGSGFERFISSLAIRIALLDMSNLPKINFLAIDEGFSAFDTHNINNVGQILDYLKTKFDFILTISHLTQIKENSDIIIGLQKDENGYTKIIQ
jgi:DNA repair exonuclease SbcCD ATPase subunit